MAVSSYGNIHEVQWYGENYQRPGHQYRGARGDHCRRYCGYRFDIALFVGEFEIRQPNTLKVCTMLDKPSQRKMTIQPDYNGFEIPNVLW